VLLTFLQSQRVLKVGVHIKADLTRLFKDCGLSEPHDPPFVGAVELGHMAKDRNLVKKANIGLADLTSLVLRRHLPKDSSIRVSGNWDNIPLTPAQEEYAIMDVFATWSIFEAFSATTASSSVTEQTLGGTQVKLLSRDHSSTVAFGIVAPDRPPKFQGVNVSKTRILVNITTVTVPAYLVPAELLESHVEKPLSSFGPALPFALLCSAKDLRVCIGNEYPSQTGPTRAPLPNLPHISSQDPYTASGEPSADSGVTDDTLLDECDVIPWTDGVDLDLNNEQSIENAKADPLGTMHAESLTKLSRLPVPDSPIRTRVSGDVYHLMAKFKIDVHHGIRRPFARALRDAIFIPDPDDKLRVSKFLEQKQTSYSCASDIWPSH
jgi:hypothetical protein